MFLEKLQSTIFSIIRSNLRCISRGSVARYLKKLRGKLQSPLRDRRYGATSLLRYVHNPYQPFLRCTPRPLRLGSKIEKKEEATDTRRERRGKIGTGTVNVSVSEKWKRERNESEVEVLGEEVKRHRTCIVAAVNFQS